MTGVHIPDTRESRYKTGIQLAKAQECFTAEVRDLLADRQAQRKCHSTRQDRTTIIQTIKYKVMSYPLQSSMGPLEAVIDDNCGLRKFYSIANVMAKELKVKFIDKADESDIVEWHFKYKGQPLTLHYNIYNGVSIFHKAGKPNKVISELANFLRGKVF